MYLIYEKLLSVNSLDLSIELFRTYNLHIDEWAIG